MEYYFSRLFFFLLHHQTLSLVGLSDIRSHTVVSELYCACNQMRGYGDIALLQQCPEGGSVSEKTMGVTWLLRRESCSLRSGGTSEKSGKAFCSLLSYRRLPSVAVGYRRVTKHKYPIKFFFFKPSRSLKARRPTQRIQIMAQRHGLKDRFAVVVG